MYYLPTTWTGLVSWCKNFLKETTSAAVLLNEPPADIAAIQADVQELLDAAAEASQAAEMLKSAKARQAAAKKKCGLRIRKFVTRMKANPLYNQEIGGALRIINGTRNTDKSSLRPVLRVIISGGLIRIHFTKNGMRGLNVYSELPGEAGFSPLGTALKTGFTDPRPASIAGVPELRKYKGMYIADNNETGQWSEVVMVNYSG